MAAQEVVRRRIMIVETKNKANPKNYSLEDYT